MSVKFKGKAIRDLTPEERLEFADSLIDRDAARWKEYIRGSESLLEEFISRASDNYVLRPPQK